ncbi:MAG: hypothetical protein HYX76_10135 [Acidobacteria bacterium]|nr:hypothetical protein [Acidobacteriota bacterium]
MAGAPIVAPGSSWRGGSAARGCRSADRRPDDPGLAADPRPARRRGRPPRNRERARHVLKVTVTTAELHAVQALARANQSSVAD